MPRALQNAPEFDDGVYRVSIGGSFVGVLSAAPAWECWALFRRITDETVKFDLISGKAPIANGDLDDFKDLLATIPDCQGETFMLWTLHVVDFDDSHPVP